eukprot:1151394_1
MAAFLYIYMCLLLNAVRNVRSTIYYNDSRTEYYAHWMSLMSLFSNEAYYGFNVYDLRLFDIILPGSHHSGMYESAIRTNPTPSKDSYFSAISFLNDTDRYIKWSIRQHGSIYDQLLSGCRYLDVRLEKSGSEYYAHHGMLGASLTYILADITKYMSMMHGEIILIHLSEFIEINASDLDVIYYQILSSLGSFMADSANTAYDISTDTITELVTHNGIQIIVFIETNGLRSESGRYDTFFFNAQDYLVGDDELRINPRGKRQPVEQATTEAPQQPLSTQTLISNTLFQLTAGWNHDANMNLIYWDVNIEHPLQTIQYITNYDSFFVVHNEFIRTLRSTIAQYPKVYFGNIIIIDFVEDLSTDEIMILIMNYARCTDRKWGATKHDCPQLSALSKLYKTSGVSTACQLNQELQEMCPRSCGLCDAWISGVPNTPCTTASDCDSAIYTATRALYDVNVSCNEGICLSPFAQAGCTVTDVYIADINECDSRCLFDYECESATCSSSDSICLVDMETLIAEEPTQNPTPMQCYCDHVYSTSAAEFRESVAPYRDEDDYFASLTGFALIPIIIGSCLLGIYCCCCFLFCAWGDWSKYTFCRCLDDLNGKYCWFKWIFAVLLFIVLIIMTWQCIEGLQANTSMHNHLFYTTPSQPVSFKSEVVDMLDIATARFENVGDDVVWIASIMAKATGEIERIIERTDFSIDMKVDAIYKMLEYIVTEYDDFALTATVVDPMTMQPMDVELKCSFCGEITDSVMSINASLATAIDSVKEIEMMIKQYSVLIASQADIVSALDSFSAATISFTQGVSVYEEAATYAMDAFEVLDTQRVYAGQAIFMAPLFGISLFCIAMGAFAMIAWMAQCAWISEWCFRCTWCSMMCIGSLMMILFGCLAVINVGWADACVYLDALEDDPISTTPSSFHDGAKVINACWTGDNLFDTFNLSQIQFWSEYQDNISVHLNFDLLKAFDVSQLDLFSSEIELMDIDEFHTQSDLYLAHLNQVGPPCTCNCLPWGTQQGAFTRSKFQNAQCFEVTQCWMDVSQFMGDIVQLSQSLSGLSSLDVLNADIPDLDELSTGLPDITDLMSYANIAQNIPPPPPEDIDMFASELDTLQQSMASGVPSWDTDDLNQLMEINNNMMMVGLEAYDAAECIEYISLAYGSVMAEYVLFNETVAMINQLKDEVYNVSQTYDTVFMVGVDIENVLGNVTYLITPLLNRFNLMIDNYARCGFLGEIYGGFKQVTCVYVFEDIRKITSAMMIISILSIVAVLLALCTQYVFHPVKKFVTYRAVYGDDVQLDRDQDMIECPQCHVIFPLSHALHPAHEEHKEEEAEAIVHLVEKNSEWEEYRAMMVITFYTFAGYVPWAKYVGLYMSAQELGRFLQIVCIDDTESVFDLIDSDIKDGRITFNEWMEYFTDKSVNMQCVQIKQHIEKQVTWQLLVKALKIIRAMDADHSGKLEYNEFVNFGHAIGLNDDETQVLFNTMDTNQTESIDITELFEWFRHRLYQQREQIQSTSQDQEAKIQLQNNNNNNIHHDDDLP